MDQLSLLPWNRFGNEWLTSRTATRLFSAAALLTLALTAILLEKVDSQQMRLAGKVLWTAIAMAGVPSLFFLWLGMWRYWSRMDSSTSFQKRLWFVVLLLGFWYGSCLYLLCVYR